MSRLSRPTQYVTAIETRFRGYRFRSRLEARYAVMLETLGAKWNYEHEGYRLRIGGREKQYLPDFYLPDLALHLEIKPSWDAAIDAGHVLSAFRSQVGPILVLVDIPTVVTPRKFRNGLDHAGYMLCTMKFAGGREKPVGYDSFLGIVDGDTVPVVLECNQRPKNSHLVGFYDVCLLGPETETIHDDILAYQDEPYPSAIEAARSARFEHGEQG